jgi:predicted nucleic acid-binding protein
MSRTIFLDTPIFFQCIENRQLSTVIEHAINAGYQVCTSITVLGEAFTQMYEKPDAVDYITRMHSLFTAWDVTALFPKDRVRILCYWMGEDKTDTRMIREPTDRTHLAYAMAYRADYFLTSDNHLIKYCIPLKLQEAGFVKPETMPLKKFRDDVLKKK